MKTIIKSPLNYTGGKFKLMPQILPLLPNDIDNFVDLFGGGCNVGINVSCTTNIYNEKVYPIYDFFANLYTCNIEEVENLINSILVEFNHIKTNEDFYKLREAYNKDKDWIKLFVLSGYAFNYSLRFNSKNNFNVPSGINRCSLSKEMRERLSVFAKQLKKKNFIFINKDFKDFDINCLNKNDFVYCDPPYLLTNAHYNSMWNEEEEINLLNLLDKLNDKSIRFALSNVIYHKGKEHTMLIEWAKKYNTHILDMHYNNSWTAGKKLENRNSKTIEVLITNY